MDYRLNFDMIDTQTKIRCCNVDLESLEFDGETVLCRVCGDKASGFHYGVHACEGCKGFFRRSIQQKIQYRACLKNQECTISRVNRNRCQYCRLKKCIAVGMSRDAVRFGRVPKKEKAKILEQMQKVNLNSQTNYLTAILQNDNHVISQTVKAHAQTNEFTREKFERFQKRAWQKPEFITCSSNKACPLNPYPEGNSDKRWTEMSDSFTPAIQSVVDFAKAIPGFTVLNQEDQVTLLKAGTFEVLLLRLSCLFDCQTNTMLFVDGKLYKKTGSEDGSGGFLQDSMFEFAERLNDLKLTDDEMGLFAGIVIIASNRPGLRNTEHVECIQAKLTHGLQTMLLQNHPDDPALFGKLLMKIADLRTLNALHSEKLLGMSLCRYSSNRKTVEPATDDGRVTGEEANQCPFSQQRAQSLAPPPPPTHPPYPPLLSSANDAILPNIKQDLTSLPVANYQSQLDMVKKIKADVAMNSIPPLERVVENAATPVSSPSRTTSQNQNFLSHWRERTSGKLPAMDSYLHASMMNHLKQNVLAANAERDKFHTVRGILNSTSDLLYSPYYPYSRYPSDVLYPYYPYTTRYQSTFLNNPELDLTKASRMKDYRERSPQPEQRWRLDSTGSRNSVKTEESSSPGNSSSSSPNGWSEIGRGRSKETRSPVKEMASSPRAENLDRDQGNIASNPQNIVSEPLNLCTMDAT